MKKILFCALALLMGVAKADGQRAAVTDKDIVGTWMMEWMQYDGEKKLMCGKESGYTSFKFYGPDGEYACCEIVLSKKGDIVLYPHEYGTYTYKNGRYSEMGRPVVKPTDMMLTDKTHFMGRWANRTEVWTKLEGLPEKVVRHIVNTCKQKEVPEDIKKVVRQRFFLTEE